MNAKTNATKITAKKAYTKDLELMRAKLAKLQTQLDGLIGEGIVSDQVHWGHVGDLRHINTILDEAIDVRLNHPKAAR